MMPALSPSVNSWGEGAFLKVIFSERTCKAVLVIHFDLNLISYSSHRCPKQASCSIFAENMHCAFTGKSLRVQASLSVGVILNNCLLFPYQNHKGAGLSSQKTINSEPNLFPLRITHIHHIQCVLEVIPGDGVSALDSENVDLSSRL